MATYVLLHGAGSDSWYWHLVVPQLERHGHEVFAVDLPVDDESASFSEYADVVAEAVGDRTDVILVAQSISGFVAPLVCTRIPVSLLVLVAAMIPRPRESAGEWWAHTDHAQARRALDERDGRLPDADFDPTVTFLHDLPPDLLAEALAHGAKAQADRVFVDPLPIDEWPSVKTKVLVCRDDRFFPLDFQVRVSRERLGITPDEMDGGHLPALANPKELVARLEEYRWDASL